MLQLSRRNAIIIRMPPVMEAPESAFPLSSQSTMATRNMVRRAATEERTGDVSEMRTRKEPENTVGGEELDGCDRRIHHGGKNKVAYQHWQGRK